MAITRIGNIASTIPDDSIQNAKFSNIVQSKNIIINGDMSIAQRGTSTTGITGAGYFTVDRYKFNCTGQGTFTMSQETDVPTGQGFAKSTKLDCTTADASPASGDLIRLEQRVEGQNLQYLKKGTANAESVTLSFWVKSSKTGTYICEIDDADNSRNINKSYTINSANTWEKKEITFAGDTTGAFTNDNNLSMFVIWWLGAGSTYTSGTLQTSWGSTVNANRAVGQVNLADSTSNDWYVTGIQLEAGTTASDFEFLPVDVNFNRCERYYHKTEQFTWFLMGRTVNTGYALARYFFRNTMRASPTMSTGGSFNTGSGYGGVPTFTETDVNGTGLKSASTTGANTNLWLNDGVIIADAEL